MPEKNSMVFDNTYLYCFVLEPQSVECVDRFLSVFRSMVIYKTVAQRLPCKQWTSDNPGDCRYWNLKKKHVLITQKNKKELCVRKIKSLLCSFESVKYVIAYKKIGPTTVYGR